MKKIIIVAMFAIICSMPFITGCATTKNESMQTKEKSAPSKAPTIEYEDIDWDGAVVGKAKATWPADLQDDGLASLEKYPGIREKIGKKHYFITEAESPNKKLAREEARNAISIQLAQQLNTKAVTSFDQVIDKSEDYPSTIGAVASSANFTGFERIAETWYFRLKTDHRKNDKQTEEYLWYCLYVIDPDIFQPQCDTYLRNIIGKIVKSEKQQEAEKLRKELVKEIYEKGIPLSE